MSKVAKLAAVAALMLATPAVAEDGKYAAGSTAKEWGLTGEEKATFTAKVVDIMCEVTGNCVDACGNGTRQIGLIRESDGALIFPNKNGQPAFSGAAVDLAPYCGKTVDVDGVLVGGDEVAAGMPKIYMVQKIREAGGEKFKKTNQFTKKWAKAHPEAKGKGPWFRRDPRILSEIEKTGYLGLGNAADVAFIKENY